VEVGDVGDVELSLVSGLGFRGLSLVCGLRFRNEGGVGVVGGVQSMCVV
jgi:hypothetical protein